MIKKCTVIGLVGILTACTTPKPFTVDESYTKAVKELQRLSCSNVNKKTLHLDYYEALARSVKYNLDYRIKLVNVALQAGQLDVAAFTMFPSLNFSGSIYTRSNDYLTSGITSEGIETGLSTSTPRTLKSARMALSWNLLDFGLGYVRAKQQSDRVLIAEEESRQQLQQLAQDVLTAYWVAYSAQQLIDDTKQFQSLLANAKHTLEAATHDSTVPKESLLNYQAALLEGSRRLIQLQYKYDKAMLDLKHLLFLPLDQKIVLAKPPKIFFQPTNLQNLDLQKMDTVTLVNHPQLRGQNYQERIVKFGLKTVLLQALPGMTLNYGWNYNSNKFLLNNIWLDKSFDIAWNLLNVVSLPTSYKTARIQVHYEHLKAMAITMAVLTQERYAFAHYQTLRDEYLIVHKQTENSKSLYHLNRDRKLASLASHQQVLLAKLRTITAQMDENLLLSDLSVALGELYLSVGVDLVPSEVIYQPLPQAICTIKNHFKKNYTSNFINYIDYAYLKIFTDPSMCKKKSMYTWQLFGSYNVKKVQELQNTFTNKKYLAIGKTKHVGRDWYVLVYGKFEKKNRTQKLPEEIQDYKPWARQIDDLTLIG